MIDVLSHIPFFDSLFSSARSLLCENGKLVLKVGEVAKTVSKSAIYDWGIPAHLHFLGMNTIQFICRKYRFKTLRHDRQPLSTDLFSASRWKAPGRSPLRNAVKRIVRTTPFALRGLAMLYDRKYGGQVYSSFVVLTPDTAPLCAGEAA